MKCQPELPHGQDHRITTQMAVVVPSLEEAVPLRLPLLPAADGMSGLTGAHMQPYVNGTAFHRSALELSRSACTD